MQKCKPKKHFTSQVAFRHSNSNPNEDRQFLFWFVSERPDLLGTCKTPVVAFWVLVTQACFYCLDYEFVLDSAWFFVYNLSSILMLFLFFGFKRLVLFQTKAVHEKLNCSFLFCFILCFNEGERCHYLTISFHKLFIPKVIWVICFWIYALLKAK